MRSFRVERALQKLGADIRDARKRRRITVALMAERIGVTRVTLAKIEKGDPKVSMGSYALALYVLGKIDELEKLIDRTNDPLGLDMMDERLPKRIRVVQ
ncbi:helix-turn-helix transcriptional regulator [Mycoavidus cysteinexigens]|nr:helix-turn-helix domain-containing protein [Mycoavidus cysteinexigens]GAM52576.1 putative DNA-binding protein [bacterium endosymbiont of Mortierella elongata FMR23-6]